MLVTTESLLCKYQVTNCASIREKSDKYRYLQNEFENIVNMVEKYKFEIQHKIEQFILNYNDEHCIPENQICVSGRMKATLKILVVLVTF